MQFVNKGPDIPDSLLQAHEDGRVVFFCGAGISYIAGLPGFKGLVDKIYRVLGTMPDLIEEEAYGQNQFDATLGLLERRIPGQRIAVRTALAKALKPDLRRRGATDTHTAMLQLARTRGGILRLVTTNFDRIFEKVAKRAKQKHTAFVAPMLPIPKNSRWNGLVYLHGLLPDKEDETALHRLVITSGDFGLAYLTERWAARFVSELFRNYVVCFVGYSINDPVMRYMMDALAADRMQGEVTPQAFAFGDCELGQERSKTIEWEAKGVTPILYEVPSGNHDHSALHSTLKAWGETYRDGILGKERIVFNHALVHPSDSTRQDNFVGRMLWALSHKSGIPAQRFADFDPVPPLTWLEAFSENRYQQDDLIRFGVPPREEKDDKLKFSIVCRPAPYTHAPWMVLASGGVTDSRWDDVMFYLARWLVRHLNDPDLIIWLSQRGGQLHNRWRWLIERELTRFATLEREGKVKELQEIRANAPNAIPGPMMQKLWRLMLTGRVKLSWRDLDLYRWKEWLERDGLTTTLRLELRELLSPKVELKRPFRWRDVDGEDDEKTNAPEKLSQLVGWELVLADDHVHSAIQDLDGGAWREALPKLLDDFQQLLRDALDLFHELGESDESSDDLPSISDHWQNRDFRDWVTLIELLRDSWMLVRSVDSARATRIAQGWFELPYSTFKRLAFFAASQDGCIVAEQWARWLLTDGAKWLWTEDLHREIMRLLVLQGRHLCVESQQCLEMAILQGPPHEENSDALEPDRLQSYKEYSVWLRLAKLGASGLILGKDARQRLDALSSAHTSWNFKLHEREEFRCWMSGTDDPDYEESRDISIAPRKRQELVKWLKQPSPEKRPFYEDTWRETCRTHFFQCFYALCDLSQEGLWPIERWIDAIRVWSEEGKVKRSWRVLAPHMQTVPDNVLEEVSHSVSWWLEAVSKSIDQHEMILIGLCQRLLGLLHYDGVDTDRPVSRAINHPVGHITRALLNLWFKREPNDNDTLPDDIKPLFTQLCDIDIEQFRHGRVLLASRLIALFRVDRHWTEMHLMPLFDWGNSPVEAKAAWEGFLWSPRLYRQLMVAFKSQFLATANHYEELNEHKRQFTAFLTYVALDQIDGYTTHDFQVAIGGLPQQGLDEVAQALSQAIESAGEQCEDYWRNRVLPFLQHVWPKSCDIASNSIAQFFARMSIAARGEFPAALTAIQGWLKPIERPHYVVRLMCKSGLAERFPKDALKLLDAILDNQPWVPKELSQCLLVIAEAEPSLKQDHRFQRLEQYSRRQTI